MSVPSLPLSPGARGTAAVRRPPGVARPSRARVLVALASALALPLLGLSVRGSTVEMAFMETVSARREGPLETLTWVVYRALEPLNAAGLAMLLAVAVGWALRSGRAGVWFGASTGLAWLPIWLVKFAVERPRPDARVLENPLLPTPVDPSFPSGHTAFAIILVVMLGFVLVRPPWRRAWQVGGPLVVALVAGTVVAAGVHYPSDALTSIAWGLLATPVVAGLVARAIAPQLLLPRGEAADIAR